jgi:DNA polymerase-1
VNGPLSTVKVHFVDSIDTLMEMKRWAGERRETPMGVDTESGGLSAWHTKLRTIQVGDKHHGWCVPWDQWGGGALEILQTYEGGFTWHNLPHDAKFMKVHTGYDIPWHRTDDTLIGARIQDPTRPAGLKPLVSKLIDKTALIGQKVLDDSMKKQGWTWATVPINFGAYWAYAALDPVLNCHLWEKIIPDVQQRFGIVYDLEMAIVRIATKMMLKGAQLDPVYIEVEREKLQQFSTEARLWLKITYGITSPLSAGQISRALTELGVEISIFTDAGAPKMDKGTLEFYQKTSLNPRVQELCQYVLAVRHADKLKGTYLDAFMDLADSDGILHASINTLAARTSRMSMSDPNLQNLPRDDKMIRGSIVPREGNVLVTCDLDQVEARLGAHFSEDPGLIEAFRIADNGGTDFFCTVASGIYGDDITNKKDPRRQPTKNVFYGSLYGAGARKMAETAGIPFEQMDPVKRAFDAAYPGLKETLERVYREAMARDKPYIITPFGRHIPLDKERAFTQGLNSLIQGHAAEVFKVNLTRMEAAGLDEYLLLPVHDEVIADVPREMADEVAREISECMSDDTTYRVKISAGTDILAERWQKM